MSLRSGERLEKALASAEADSEWVYRGHQEEKVVPDPGVGYWGDLSEEERRRVSSTRLMVFLECPAGDAPMPTFEELHGKGGDEA